MENDTTQLSFLNSDDTAKDQPAECLGMTFKNEDHRREYFREELRKKLPELKKIEGYPTGEDEDIIIMSDPPYYTACPNPWINDLILNWKKSKENHMEINTNQSYSKKPFTADVNEGKTDPLYLVHSYHTKVPHRAIMRNILHYTNPGDLVYDGFAGTGMTGVAALLCNSKKEIEKIGYTVSNNGEIYDEQNNYVSKIGSRKAVINDLSPVATFISSILNTRKDIQKMLRDARRIIDDAEKKYGYLYKTRHTNDAKGDINYVLWSDVFICPNCSHEINYWDIAVEEETLDRKSELICNHCSLEISKRNLERAKETTYDIYTKKTITTSKQRPVLINYLYENKRFFKKPDLEDMKVIKELKDTKSEYYVPTSNLPQGFNTKQPIKSHGFTQTHHFYTDRNLLLLSYLWEESKSNLILKFCLNSIMVKTASKLHNVGLKKGKVNLAGSLPNVLFVPSISAERNLIILLKGKLKDVERANINRINDNNVISTGSFGMHQNKENLYDYIFIDPPFGANLMYSELNFIWESWHKVFTNNEMEAIENKDQGKTLADYGNLMKTALKKAFYMLKENHWITIEFSNTSAAVWNTIQRSVEEAGFIIANVSALNKGQGTFFSQTNPTSVKQDLIITAYKPVKKNIEKMIQESNTIESVWTFINQHLKQLPLFFGSKESIDIIAERTPRILFDRMVAYHVQNQMPVPVSSGEFQLEVSKRFPMRDGMIFLENQVAEYDKKRTLVKEFSQLNLFVSDENSAIEWLRQQLLKKPQTRQDIHPQFMKELQHINKHEMLPELDELLNQNFLRYDGEDEVPSQILTHLRRNYKDLRGLEATNPKVIEKARHRWFVPNPNKQADLERLREKSLLREYENYLKEIEGSKKKLKVFRTEAIRAGFKKAYSEKDFESIVQVGDRIPEKVIQEDDKLLMYYDNALIRMGL